MQLQANVSVVSLNLHDARRVNFHMVRGVIEISMYRVHKNAVASQRFRESLETP